MNIKVFSKFFSVGAISTVLQYIVLMLLVELLSVDAVIASSIGYIAGAVFNYAANYYLTFKSNASHVGALIKFSVVVTGGLLINYGLMLLLVDYFAWPYLIGQVIATGIVFFYNFFAHRSWTYKG